MCGLCGMAGYGAQTEDIKFFRELLYVSALRGEDSTGVSSIKLTQGNKKERILTEKFAADASQFLYVTKNNSDLYSIFNDIMIGHCRWATSGNITKANAHPFVNSKLVGAHNGTLYDLRFNPKEGDETDSELMFKEMAERGVVDTLNDLSISSAYAISVYEKNSGVLKLARNNKRPLHIAVSKERDMMYWASESGMLDFIAKRLGMKIEIFSLMTDYVYSFPIEEIKNNTKSFWSVDKLKEKTPHYAGYASWYDWENEDTTENTSTAVAANDSYTEAGYTNHNNATVTAPHAPWDFECSDCGNVVGVHDISDSRVETATGGVLYMCKDCRKAIVDLNQQSVEELKKTGGLQ